MLLDAWVLQSTVKELAINENLAINMHCSEEWGRKTSEEATNCLWRGAERQCFKGLDLASI